MKFESKLVSSLTKIFPDAVQGETISTASALKNEPFSFQVAFRTADGDLSCQPVCIRVESDLPLSDIASYKVGYVPVLRCTSARPDPYYDRTEAGLFPDPLFRRQTDHNLVNDGFWAPRYFEEGEKYIYNSVGTAWQGVWLTVNEDGNEIAPGEHYVDVQICRAYDLEVVTHERLELTILDACLPPMNLIYTSWFHCDCIADTYNVPVFSDRHYEIMASFVREAARTGMNMIMLPAFTPPLDTPVGKERPTVQLVRVKRDNGEYSFDFTEMERYINMCRDNGISFFEHNHMFTQWGARSTPKIFVEVDGVRQQYFGWDTDAGDPEYARFLKAYLRALKEFLNRVGVGKRIFFPISDEPNPKNEELFNRAYNLIAGEIEGYPSGDSISHFRYYENGSIHIPSVSVASEELDRFIKECDRFMVYSTGESLHSGYPNRVITNTGARMRFLGVQMYVTHTGGYAHWGYNYYYDTLSHGLFNPMNDPCGYDALPGTSFIVYPGLDGTAIPSLRMKLEYEGFCDNRALQLLEEKIGRAQTLAWIKEQLGEVTYQGCPSNETVFAFRQSLNRKLAGLL